LEYPAFNDSNFRFCPEPRFIFFCTLALFLASPVLRSNAATIGSASSKVQLQPTAGMALTRARYTRVSGGFRFFAFTSSLLGRISLKTSILRVKVSLLPKNDYLSLIQRFRGEGCYLHLGGRDGRAAERQKRRSKMPFATAVRRVKAAHRKAHTFAFTRNTLCNR
jgi:hypothetical protein